MPKFKLFNTTIDADNNEEAIEWAQGFVFSECEYTVVSHLPTHSREVTDLGDIKVWYDFGADYYFFTENTSCGLEDCPKCRSTSIEFATTEYQGLEVRQDAYCTDCGAEWRNVYEYTKYELVEE